MAANYYQLLGIRRSATLAEIKSAYRRLAMQRHPDRNKHPDATRRFRMINEAYQCLADPASRPQHDEMLDAWKKAGIRDEERSPVPAELPLTPEMVMAFFARIDAWLQGVFAAR